MLLDHNVPVYEEFAKMLDDTGEVFLVSDTGTGKSYNTNEYVTTHNCKTLVVSLVGILGTGGWSISRVEILSHINSSIASMKNFTTSMTWSCLMKRIISVARYGDQHFCSIG